MTLDGRLDVTVDDGVEFAFTLTNTGEKPIELAFRSGSFVDFAVYETDTEVWRWSDGRMVTQALHSETVAPDGSVTYRGRWDDPEPGAYTAVATLQAENASLGGTTEFVVE